MSNETGRRRFTPEEKFEIVKQVITRSKSVSEVCVEKGFHVNQYYRWQKEFYEGALERFMSGIPGRKSALVERERDLAQKEVHRLNEVVAAVVKENIDLKKKNYI